MSQLPLVGRRDVLQKLVHALADAWNQHGKVIFVEGVAGMGKTVLLKMLQEEVGHFPELEKAIFTYGHCYDNIGPQNAYQPFIDILEVLTKIDGRKNVGALTATILKETAPDWLQIVPIIGPALGASVKSASVASQWFLDATDDGERNQARSLMSQYTNTLTRLASRQNFLVLIIEDAHWIDDASCQLLLRLATKIGTQPMIVLVTYRPDYLDAHHPLKKVQREMLAKDLAQVIRLQGLTEEQIRHYILKRFGAPLHGELAAWLLHLCKGNPLFVTQYLSLLEQDTIIRREGTSYVLDGNIHYTRGMWQVSGVLASVLIPDSLDAVLEQRIERLLEEDREMLQLGAVQGDAFMSAMLAELLAKKEIAVLARLRQVVEHQFIISLHTGEDWLKKRSEFYIFEHHLMQQALYTKLSPRERELHHYNVAQYLERQLNEQKQPSRRLLLEIAYHYSMGGEPVLGAKYYFRAAQSSFLDGFFVETIELCKSACELLQPGEDQDRLLAEVIWLLLVASEARWRGKLETQGELPLAALIQKAEAAAQRVGDRALLAQIQYIKGKIVLISEGLSHSIQILEVAVKTAQESGDQLTEFVIMSELGHRRIGQNLALGLKTLYQAHDLYTQILAAESVPRTKALERHLSHLQGMIGVAEFDRGEYDVGEKWLKESIIGLKKLGMHDDLPRMLNFLAQLYIATGRFEEAEQTLKEAVTIPKEEGEVNSYNGYNLALLGKLYIEWKRYDAAEAPLLKGWQETQATWNLNLVPLVRNYYAEWLIHPESRGHNVSLARQLLTTTVEEVQKTGFHRSGIAALTLLSRLSLLTGENETALDYSTQAINYLQRVGIMPALRTEEVLFDHYQSLKANGCEHKAFDYLQQANTVIQEKSRSIQDDVHRRAFLERVPVSYSIKQAMDTLPEPDRKISEKEESFQEK